MKPAGDVIHVFSHIKKTYRVQWVVLEGTPDPPQLATPSDLPPKVNGAKGAGKGKGKSRKADKSDVVLSQWVPLNAVTTKK